jgi:polyisoprenoid-binding protein YceI
LPDKASRRLFLAAAASAGVASWPAAADTTDLTIGSARGTIDFAIGDSKIFRATGSFRDWEGKVTVDDDDIPNSSVHVVVHTDSLDMLDEQQTTMLKDADFFDVSRFPAMIYRSTAVTRTGEMTLHVEGVLTLRGITRPMALQASVTNRVPDARPGRRYATFRAEGSLKRSEYGMTRYVDVVGDAVDINIRTDAWR